LTEKILNFSTKFEETIPTENFLKEKMEQELTVENKLQELIATTSENIVLRKITILKAGEGERIFSYIHNTKTSNLGEIGSIVSISNPKLSEEELNSFGVDIAMHIAGKKKN
jgi:translation elongation factor EF-Ts